MDTLRKSVEEVAKLDIFVHVIRIASSFKGRHRDHATHSLELVHIHIPHVREHAKNLTGDS